MKREYGRPVMVVEAFEANEYVATCYKLKCSFPSEYKELWEEKKGEGFNKDQDTFKASIKSCTKEVTIQTEPYINGYVTKNKGMEAKPAYWWADENGLHASIEANWKSAGNHS